MIVKCESCQTRFRIPDEKVTEKGVKVRCTKCAHTFRVSKTASPAETAPADPFAQFAPAADPPMDQATRPGFYAHGVSASKPAEPRAKTSAPADLSDLFGSAPEPSGPAVPVPAAPAPRAAASLGSAGEDYSDVFNAPTRVAMVPPASVASPTRAAADPVSRAVKSAPAPAPKSSAPLELAPDPFAAQPSQLLADLPPPDDLFGGLTGPQAQLTTSGSHPLDLGAGAPDRGLFDIPEPKESAPAPTGGGADPFGMFGQQEAPAPSDAPQVSAVPAATVQRPAGRPEDARGLEEVKGLGVARRFSGLIVNVSVAALLVVVLLTVGSVYLNEGRLHLSDLSLQRARELFAPPRTLVVRDLSNGLYDTLQGRPVFFVRGEVENRSELAGRARVRAEILDGDTLVRSVEGFAGEVPTPEELHAVQSAEDVRALTQRLDRGAQPVAPGQRVSFLLAFYEFPPDLAAYRLRVTVLPEDGAAASR
ncbi:MAG: zinc-ribbon domain-containing protein [Myxococcota bacterium]|nr:zinc-ribbon domain-containing protein [Myxococcota bacterium]